ncbi:3-phosphoshikimate 1-carboxyvinyltransferase [Priestia taiwanensis]|uniref:3-phosphoshikimate 1-carboxyvinyltransferase n=1 Tax=Priestia taiwanensis TaxID=1347902 RepID=A0A917AJS6_9BACI|nr:3-phosphoshikimate 1-carboxyvinyltransferase [Priestia taiwanensis]MBM7361710.1 3-phosphoshikimate 1-carboxyvinyltransferase [Priestia taiwanensis]GGE56375.1 3-phosphoshikimate 1-carboxyvinyltransferase [Priestia taiwanensis]
MEKLVLTSTRTGLNGTITVPGDKSISHRAVMFGSIAKGKTTVQGFLPGEDCLSTIDCFRKLGVKITQKESFVEIEGDGLEGLIEPTDILNVGNSGTTIRLMFGVLANTPFHSCLIGDDSIAKRPMKRVTEPLREMGVAIEGRQGGNYTPVSIRGGNVIGIHYTSPVASAQVKSAILLAGLQAEGETIVTEPAKSRDHTERMLRAFGVDVEVEGLTVTLKGKQSLRATDIVVPGDISSAAFWLVAGAVVPNSRLVLEGVGVNPTRTGIIDVLEQMGANIHVEMEDEEVEPIATITIETSSLRGIEIGGDIIPRLIDEIPIIALAASQAEGVTIIKDAKELRVKETDRIQTVVDELTKLGVHIEATEDGMKIYGGSSLSGNTVNSYGDHRIGMMLAIASLLAKGETTIEQAHSVAVSYPNFFEQLKELAEGVKENE